MASEVEIEAPESVATTQIREEVENGRKIEQCQKITEVDTREQQASAEEGLKIYDGTLGKAKEDEQGKKILEVSKGSDERTDSECFLNPPTVDKVACDDTSRGLEDFPEAEQKDQAEITALESSDQQRDQQHDTEKSEATEEEPSVVDVEGKETSKEELIQRSEKENGEDGNEEVSPVEPATSPIDSDRVLVSEIMNSEKETEMSPPESTELVKEKRRLDGGGQDSKLEEASNTSFEDKLENETSDDDKNSQCDMVNTEKMHIEKVDNVAVKTLLPETDSETTVKDTLENADPQNGSPEETTEATHKEISDDLVSEETLHQQELGLDSERDYSHSKLGSGEECIEQKTTKQDETLMDDTARSGSLEAAEDTTSEADAKEITGILDGDLSHNENDSSLGNDSVEKEDETQEPSSKVETIEEDEQLKVVASEERIQNENAVEVSESTEYMPSEGKAEGKASLKDIDLATGKTEEEKGAESLELESDKKQDKNNSEELTEPEMEMKASESDLQKSGATSDEKEELIDATPTEVDDSQHKAVETVQESLPGLKAEVNESKIRDEDKEEHTEENIESTISPTEKEAIKSTLSEEHTHKDNKQDSATQELVDDFDESEVTNLQQDTYQHMAEDSAIEETAEGVKDETEELSPEKIEELKRSTSPETTALKQSNENLSLDETLGSSIQKCERSLGGDGQTFPRTEFSVEEEAEEIDNPLDQLKAEENNSIRSTEIDGQIEQTPLLPDPEGKPTQALEMCNEEEHEPVPTGDSEMNTEAPKEEGNQNSIEISENKTVNSAEEVDATGQQNRDEPHNFEKSISEGSEVQSEKNHNVTPNSTEENSVAELTEESLRQSHQIVEESAEHVGAESTVPADDYGTCGGQSTEPVKKEATRVSFPEDIATEETNDSSFANDSIEENENHDVSSKIEPIEENNEEKVVSSEETIDKEKAPEVSESTEFTPTEGHADEEATAKEINLTTGSKNDEICEESLESQPVKIQEISNSEELIETDMEMKASQSDLQKSRAASDEKEDFTEDAPMEPDISQQTGVEAIQQSLPGSNPEANESICDVDKEHHTEENIDSRDFPIEKEGNEPIFSEELTHEKEDVQDSATKDVVDNFHEKEERNFQQDTHQNMGEDGDIKETADNVKDETEEKLSIEKTEEAEESTSQETIALEQSNENLSYDETLDSSIQKFEVSPIEEKASEQTSLAAEKIDDTPQQLKAEDNNPIRSTESDEQNDQTLLLSNPEGKSIQASKMCNEEENEVLQTENSEMNSKAPKEEANQQSLEISENRSINSVEEAVDVTCEQNADEEQNFKKATPEESGVVSEENHEVTPNATKEDFVAEIAEESLEQSHQTTEESAEHVEPESKEAANEDSACGSQSTQPTKDEATKGSSTEDRTAEEMVHSDMELSTSRTEATEREIGSEKEAGLVENSSEPDLSEGNSTKKTTDEAKPIKSDQNHEGAIRISHDVSTEENPEPVDAVEELDSEPAAAYDESLTSATANESGAEESRDVEEQDVKPAEHLISKGNNEDQVLSLPRQDTDLAAEGSISKADDAHQEATEIENMETQTVKQEATEEDFQHVVEREQVHNEEKTNGKDEYSSEQHDENNTSESDIAEIQKEGGEAHECSISNEIYVTDTVKDEDIVNREFEESNSGNSTGNEEAIEASQSHGRSINISSDEIQLVEVQGETTDKQLENAEGHDSNNITNVISAEEDKFEEPNVLPTQQLDEETTAALENIEVIKDREEALEPDRLNKTHGTDTVKDEGIVNQDSNYDNTIQNEETTEAYPSQDENANFSTNGIQIIEVQTEAKIDEQEEKIEDENPSNIADDASTEENLKRAEDVEELESGTKSAAADDDSITPDEANKSAEHVIQEEENDNQCLSVRRVDSQSEDEESTNKGEDTNQKANDLDLNLDEEIQNITKEVTDEDSQQVADDEEKSADVNVDSQQKDNIITEIDNIEVHENAKTHEGSGFEENYVQETQRDEELVDQRSEEIDSGNETANQGGTATSPSQDDSTMISNDGNQITEVQEKAAMEKPHENIEDEDTHNMTDNVSAEQNPEAVEKIECCTNPDAATETTITSNEGEKSATEESSKVGEHPDTKSTEHFQGHSEDEDSVNKPGDANQNPQPVDAVEKLDSESTVACDDHPTSSDANKSETEEAQYMEQDAKNAEDLLSEGHNENQGVSFTRGDNELHDEGSINKFGDADQNMKQEAAEEDFQNETIGDMEDVKDKEQAHELGESKETHGTDIANNKELENQDSDTGNATGSEETIDASPSQEENANISSEGIQVIGFQKEAKIDELQEKIEDENSINVADGASIEENPKPAQDIGKLECGAKSAFADDNSITTEAKNCAEHVLQEEQSDNQDLSVSEVDNQLANDESAKGEDANQEAKKLELTNKDQNITNEVIDEDFQRVADDEFGIVSEQKSKAVDYQDAQSGEHLLQEGCREDEDSANKEGDANQAAKELNTETECNRNEAAEEDFPQVTNDEEIMNVNVESPQQLDDINTAEIESTELQREENAHEKSEGNENHGTDKEIGEETMINKLEETNGQQNQGNVEESTSNIENAAPSQDESNISLEGIQDSKAQEEERIEAQHDELQNEDPIKLTDHVLGEVENPEYGLKPTRLPEVNTAEDEASRYVDDHEASSAETLTGSQYTEVKSSSTEGKEIDLAECTTKEEGDVDKSAEEHQINEESQDIDKAESAEEDLEQAVREEKTECKVKPMDSNTNLPQQQTEENTSKLSEEQVHEDEKTNEQCKSVEMRGSDLEKEKEIVNQAYEAYNPSNEVPNQQSSIHVEASRDNVDDDKGTPSQDESLEISSDQTQVNEVNETEARDAECQAYESEGLQKIDSLSTAEVKQVDTPVTENKKEPVEEDVKDDLNEQDTCIPATVPEEHAALEESQSSGDVPASEFNTPEEIVREENRGIDTCEIKPNITNLTYVETETPEDHPEGNIIKTLGVSPAEETQQVNEDDAKDVPPESKQLGNTIAEEIITVGLHEPEHELQDMTSTESNAKQSVAEYDLDDSQLESKTVSSISCKAVEATNVEETEEIQLLQTNQQNQLHQSSSEDLTMKDEDATTTEDKKESTIAAQAPKVVMSEERSLEKATLETESELEVSNTNSELANDLPLQQELVEESEKVDESPSTKPCDLPSEFQGASAPSERETERGIDIIEPTNIHENEVPLSNELGQKTNVSPQNDSESEIQELSESSEQALKLHHQDPMQPEEIDKEKHKNAVNRELLLEENQGKTNFDALHAAVCDTDREENLGLADHIKKLEDSTELMAPRENITELGQADVAENEETRVEVVTYEANSIGNQQREENVLSSNESETKVDECSMDKTEDVDQVAKELKIREESDRIEREATKEYFQQVATGEQEDYKVKYMVTEADASKAPKERNVSEPENVEAQKDVVCQGSEQEDYKVRSMVTEADASEPPKERNVSEPENVEAQKDVVCQGSEHEYSSVEMQTLQSSLGGETSRLYRDAEKNFQNKDESANILSDTLEVLEGNDIMTNETEDPAQLNNVSAEEIKYIDESSSTNKAQAAIPEVSDSLHEELNESNAADTQEEWAPMKGSEKLENLFTSEAVASEENHKEDEKLVVACYDKMANTQNITLVKEELSSQETCLQVSVEKALDISSTVETERADDGKQFSSEAGELAVKDDIETISSPQLEHESRDVDLAETNANQLAERLHVDDTKRGVMSPHETGTPTNCHDVEEVSAADIIASQISQAIEEEEQRQHKSSDQLKEKDEVTKLVTGMDNTFNNQVLKGEDKNDNVLEETTEQTYLHEEKEIEQPKEETEEKIEGTDGLQMLETKELPSAFQGADPPFENEIDKVSESTPEILDQKDIKDSYKLGDTSGVCTLNDTISQLVSEENCANSCTATTDDKEKSASLEKVPEIHAEECIKPEDIDLQKNHRTISGGIIAHDKTVLTPEAHQATICDAATEEAVNHTDVQGANQDLPGQEPKEQSQNKDQLDSARSLGEDEKQMTLAKNTEVLDEKVLNSQQTTESPDKAKEAITEDEEERTECNASLLSGQKEASANGKVSSLLEIPKMEASILVPRTPEATEERKAKILTDDSDSPTEPKNPQKAASVTDSFILEKCAIKTYEKPCQVSMENQEPTPGKLQEDRVKIENRKDKESLELQQEENMKKLESTDTPHNSGGDTMDASLNKRQAENTAAGECQEHNQTGSCPSEVTATTESKGNDVISLQLQKPPVESLQRAEGDESSKGKDGINETKARSMPMDSSGITALSCPTGGQMTEKGGQIILDVETHDNKEATAEEMKTDEEKDESIHQSQEDLQREIPITAEAVREMELKATQKKSHNILSGVGSKVKHSISKMKKAIACSSAQFSQEEVIIKLNKNKKA